MEGKQVRLGRVGGGETGKTELGGLGRGGGEQVRLSWVD